MEDKTDIETTRKKSTEFEKRVATAIKSYNKLIDEGKAFTDKEIKDEKAHAAAIEKLEQNKFQAIKNISKELMQEYDKALAELNNKIDSAVSVCLLTIFIERGLHENFFLAERIVFIFAAFCELWSILANILIVRPNTPFIRLLHKALAGEIAQKLNMEKEEVEKTFENK